MGTVRCGSEQLGCSCGLRRRQALHTGQEKAAGGKAELHTFSDTPQDVGFSNLTRQKPSAFNTRPRLPPRMMPEGHPVATSQRVTGDDSL